MYTNILKHESDVWKSADLLIGAGIKRSDFPKYMMPFFALILVESRMIREMKKRKEELKVNELSDDDFGEFFELEGVGYNDFIVKKDKYLKDLLQNDSSYKIDFYAFLDAFDIETRTLLGVQSGDAGEKYLDISGVSRLLEKKGILFETLKTWSEIDLTPYNNSEITTLEEHIKRKWADISAETAGEQYTPEDVIQLISEIIISKTEDNHSYLTIYDPTCGGGNMLFGVEDSLSKEFDRPIKTFGDEWNDALYALAKIESRFREESEIRHGNTLTKMFHLGKEFDIVVANPPYGVDWKGYQSDIKKDETGRFVDLPAISDGQFLFTQHILAHTAKNGMAIVVHNGSTLFSGDAGRGESNIRKFFFEQDWVEAIVQIPKEEFFNTGIHTYLWIFNKNKPKERKDKVILIDGSDKWELLKKSKGKKRRQMNADHRDEILKSFTEFKDNDFAKVFDKWEFYYNKQSLEVTNVDEEEKFLKKKIKLKPTKITALMGEKEEVIEEFEITEFDPSKYKTLKAFYDQEVKEYLKGFDYKTQDLKVYTQKAVYHFDKEKNSIVKTDSKSNQQEYLGCGVIDIKPSYKKANKTKKAHILIKVNLKRDIEKDYEIITYHPDKTYNEKLIDDFLQKYVTRPFKKLDNVVGVELNFNKVFYKPEELRSVPEIIKDLADLNRKLQDLETNLNLN